jgi:hypothetical protein
MFRARFAALALAVTTAACARTLPDQDRRIVSAPVDARVSADILWKDFQTDRSQAGRRYHGAAIVISGNVTTIYQSAVASSIFFGQAGDHGIAAHLLDDGVTAVVRAATQGQRLTLKCFCEGPDDTGNVILKSCVKPE